MTTLTLSLTPVRTMKIGGTLACLVALAASPLSAQAKLPPLPDSTGWGVHVLTLAQDPSGGIWAGTYGHGIFVLPAGGLSWRQIRSDTVPESLSWDFVHSIAFGTSGEVWYGTVGNGWGVSRDGGHTWQNWTGR